MSAIDKALGLFRLNTKRMDDNRIATLSFPDGVTESNNHEYLPDGHIYHKLDVYYPENTEGKLPVIIDIHGGGWMYGDKELNKIYCMTLAKKGYVVFNMSYRLYPEVNVRDQLWDISNALKWIKDNMDSLPCQQNNIFLTGDSAGGMLAFFTAMICGSEYLQEKFDTVATGMSFNAIGLTCPMLFMNDGSKESLYCRIMLGENYKNEKWGNLVNMDNLLPYSQVPPTFIMTSSGDFLAKKHTRKGADYLKAIGADYRFMDFAPFEGKDLPHVFPVLYPESEISQRAIDGMLSFFIKHAQAEENLTV